MSSKKPKSSKSIKKVLSIITVISLIFGIVSSSLYIQNMLTPTPSKRADLRLLLVPNDDSEWDFSSNGTEFSVNLTVSNIGDSPAIIKRFELWVIYQLPNGNFYTIPTIYEKLSSDWGLSREPIGINEDETYYLYTKFFPELYIDQNTGRIIQIGDTQAEKFQIIVVYDDGKEGMVSRIFSYE